jgi:hypothetical protein
MMRSFAATHTQDYLFVRRFAPQGAPLSGSISPSEGSVKQALSSFFVLLLLPSLLLADTSI